MGSSRTLAILTKNEAGVVGVLNLLKLAHACAKIRITANLRTKMLDFRGFDSSIIFMLRVGFLMPAGHFPKLLSQQILLGIILVGRLGVHMLQQIKSYHDVCRIIYPKRRLRSASFLLVTRP